MQSLSYYTTELFNSEIKNDIKYITPETLSTDFLNNSVKIGKGNYGNVYSKNNFAIKKFINKSPLKTLIKELNIYSLLSHPCILSPIAWSVMNGIGYLIMPLGIPIKKAIEEEKITIEQIIADTLSAICYMNSIGYAHRDIKPGNMIYYKGKCMIIDTGLSIKCILNSDGNYYSKNKSYTMNYKDPEYVEKQYNNIKVEIYSLAMSYKELLTGKIPKFGDLVDYKCNIPHIDWFFYHSSKLIKDRPSIQEILNNAPKKLIPNSRRYINEYPRFTNKIIVHKTSDLFSEYLYNTMYKVVSISVENKIKSETTFLCLHLLHRVYEKMLNKYNNDIAISRMILYVCMRLAVIVTNNNDINFPEDLEEDQSFNYEDIMINTLIILRGNISTLTYWDYAKSGEDLAYLLIDTMKIGYNPNSIRSLINGSDKNITFDKVMLQYENKDFKKEFKKWVKPTNLNRSIVHPCNLDTSSDIKLVKHYAKLEINWNNLDRYPYFISVLLYNRDIVKELDIKTSLNIFTTFLQNSTKVIVSYTLDVLCHFNWREFDLIPTFHPFRETEKETYLI